MGIEILVRGEENSLDEIRFSFVKEKLVLKRLVFLFKKRNLQ